MSEYTQEHKLFTTLFDLQTLETVLHTLKILKIFWRLRRQITRPAEREQSQCAVLGPKILTGALVRDTGTLRVSNIFPGTLWDLKK